MIFNLGKKQTLIVEDFAEFARSVRGMLHTIGGTNVDIVYNAEDAIGACKSKKYDIILSDYNLGNKKDGQQLLEELVKYRLIKSNCVFLMLTAENTSAMVMGAVEYQPDGYIAKPFNGNLFKSRLQKALEKKDAMHPVSIAISNKKWQEALEKIQNAILEFPKYKMSCLRQKFRALKELKRYDEALDLASEIVTLRSIPWAICAVGEIYYLQSKFDKAMEIFRNMTKEFPMALEGYDWLAKIQKEAGQPIDAQNTLSKATEKSPKALNRQKTLGALAEENKDLKTMTKAYREAVKYGTNSAFSSPDEYIKLTVAITKQINENQDIVQDRLIEEAEEVFQKLDKNFNAGTSVKIRSNVAHAAFCNATHDEEKTEYYVNNAKKNFEELDEQLSSNISLEISESLNILGDTELADNIISEAIQQNIDDADFIEKASKLTTNKELIQMSKQANQYNLKAIRHFKGKNYHEASQFFEKAQRLSPSNINIRLNYVQALLKLAQSEETSTNSLQLADEMLIGIPQMGFSDPRFARYSELSRLTQLMLQKTG